MLLQAYVKFEGGHKAEFLINARSVSNGADRVYLGAYSLIDNYRPLESGVTSKVENDQLPKMTYSKNKLNGKFKLIIKKKEV